MQPSDKFLDFNFYRLFYIDRHVVDLEERPECSRIRRTLKVPRRSKLIRRPALPINQRWFVQGNQGGVVLIAAAFGHRTNLFQVPALNMSLLTSPNARCSGWIEIFGLNCVIS